MDRGSLGNNKAETPIWSWLIKVHIIEPRLYMSGGYEGGMGGFSQEQGSCFRQKKTDSEHRCQGTTKENITWDSVPKKWLIVGPQISKNSLISELSAVANKVTVSVGDILVSNDRCLDPNPKIAGRFILYILYFSNE